MFVRHATVLLLVSLAFHTSAQELVAPEGWNEETIKLPPSFAKSMSLVGTEQIRFAPGMFQADSDSFFSYVLVFQVASSPALTEAVLKEELLKYYRGLSQAVMKGKKQFADTETFTLALQVGKSDKPDAQRFECTLNWIEPFATQAKQILLMDVDTWTSEDGHENFVFICASPKHRTTEIWEKMIAIRQDFIQQ